MTWLSDVDLASLNPRLVQRFIQLCMLANAKFGHENVIDFDKIYT